MASRIASRGVGRNGEPTIGGASIFVAVLRLVCGVEEVEGEPFALGEEGVDA